MEKLTMKESFVFSSNKINTKLYGDDRKLKPQSASKTSRARSPVTKHFFKQSSETNKY